MISWPFINYCLLAIMADWSITVSNRYGHYSYQRKRQTYQGNNFLTLKLFKSIAKQCSVCLLLPFVFQPFQLHPKPDISDGNQIVWYIRIVYLKCISIPSQCQHVFLTFAHRKKWHKTYASMLETCNKKESWWWGRNSPVWPLASFQEESRQQCGL